MRNRKMERRVEREKQKLGTLPYVIGGISYVPLIGVLFGIVAIVWGVVTKKLGGRRLAFVGAGGIALTVLIVGAIYSWHLHRLNATEELRAELAEFAITSVVYAVERNKKQFGTYPASLELLHKSPPEWSVPLVFDPTNVEVISLYGRAGYFHYELVDDDHYYLLGVGADGEPYTNDDVLPNVGTGPGSKSGLLIKRQ